MKDEYMNQLPTGRSVEKIASIIHDFSLAKSIHRAISSALTSPIVRLKENKSVWRVFKYSLDAAIRDIESHPRGKLFKRMIRFGPPHPDDPEIFDSDGETTLSDSECGACLEFIYSHMVNRFKGELAELLALEPCMKILNQLKKERCLSSRIRLYWGDMIKEPRQFATYSTAFDRRFQSYPITHSTIRSPIPFFPITPLRG
ncbi:MAG: hypothetical protein V2A78_05735 [bacterium]